MKRISQIAARQNLTMKAGGDMVFIGGAIKAGGNARLSAGGDLLLLAYDTGRQVRSGSPRDENGKAIGKGPEWSVERSTYNQTGVDIKVGGNLKASAGGNLVAQGVSAKVGGSTSLSAGGDMSLTTALKGHVQSYNFFNRYKSSGDFVKIEQRIEHRDIDLKNSGNTWSSGGGVNLKAGGNLSIVGAQINSKGFSARAGGNYEERAAYDIKERVSVESIERSGPGVYLADFNNNMLALSTLGEHGGKTEKDRTETHIDSTRTAIVTNINAGGGTVSRNVGGDALIEGSVIQGGRVNPLVAGGKVTAVAAVDSRHVEDSVFSSTIRWQGTKSSGSIEQTLHMPEIHGTIPAGMSAYQGAGGVSVQLPAGSNVRTAIEKLSKEPGKEYLGALGSRSDIDWQRVEALNKSLDFSKSGLTQEATIAVIIVVSILTYGAASSAGGAAATTVGASSTGAVAAGFTAGFTSLASTAAVSLINNKGDIGATLKELGSKENLNGLLLTMATAGLTQGILSNINVDGAGTLANVNAQSSIELLLAKNAVQGITSAVLESAVMGTDLEDALKSNLQGALINTVAAQGANEIGDAKLDGTSKAIAHALLGCAVGTATAGSSSGCAPGAAGAAIGEIVAGLYGDGQGLGDLEDKLKADPNNAQLKQQIAQIRNTVTELAKLSGAGAALLIGGDAGDMQTAIGTAQNAAVNNYLNHTKPSLLALSEVERYDRAVAECNAGDTAACGRRDDLTNLSRQRDRELQQACGGASASEAACAVKVQEARSMGNVVSGSYGGLVYANSTNGAIGLNTSTIGPVPRPDNLQDQLGKSTADGLLLAIPGPEDLLIGSIITLGSKVATVVVENGQKLLRFVDGSTVKAGPLAGNGANGGDTILDGASGLLNAPKSVEYVPPGSVVLQPKGSPLCGPATCNMVINDAKGNAVDLNQVVGQFQGIRTSGVNINEMNAVLGQNGVAGKTTTTLSVDQLNAALANGQPVIVGVPAGTGNHFIIVDSTKTVNNVLYYMTRDPYVGPRGVRSDILTNAINANGNAIIVSK